MMSQQISGSWTHMQPCTHSTQTQLLPQTLMAMQLTETEAKDDGAQGAALGLRGRPLKELWRDKRCGIGSIASAVGRPAARSTQG